MSEPEISAFDPTAFNPTAVEGSVHQPALEGLFLVATRRRRQRVANSALAVVVALLGAALVPVAAGGPGGWTGPDPSQNLPEEKFWTELFVIDETSAVAVQPPGDLCWQPSVRPPDDRPSHSIGFAATTDLGQTWSKAEPFRFEGNCDPDHGSLTYDVRYHPLDVRTYLISIDEDSYLSTDAGRTWRDADLAIRTVDAFPPAARPVHCGPCHGVPEPLAVDPGTREVFRLGGKPPSTHALHSLYESPDGALWSSYAPGDWPNPSTVAVSVDRGATWRTFTAPEQTNVISLAALSGDEGYLLAEPTGDGSQEPTGPSRLLRTVDGGRTWDEVDTDLPTARQSRSFTLGRGGTLLVGDSDDQANSVLWTSQDGGRHFTRSVVPMLNGFSAGPGLLWNLGEEARLSTDGVNWTRIPMP